MVGAPMSIEDELVLLLMPLVTFQQLMYRRWLIAAERAKIYT